MTWEMIGHNWAVQLLRGHIQKESPRHAYLITGPRGIGKKDLALRFIQALICPETDTVGNPCFHCMTCQRLNRMEHPDLFPVAVEKGSNQIKIDQIRNLIHSLSLSPYEASRRFGLLFEFEKANTAAQNAILKTLEEPPGSVILILIAVSSDSLLETITSRCEEIKLNTVPIQETSQGLERFHNIPADQANLLAHISGGRPVHALTYHKDPKQMVTRETLLDEVMEIMQSDSVARFAYADALSKDRQKVNTLLDVWTSFWHDILLLSGNSSAPLRNIDRQKDLERVLSEVDLKTAHAAMDRFRRAHLLLGKNANTRLTLENLLLQLPAIQG